VLLGIFVALMQRSHYASSIDECTGHFGAIFGGIRLDEHGARPTLEPEKRRYQLLEFGGLLCYSAGSGLLLPEKSTFSDYRYILAWFPACAVTAVPAGPDRFAVSRFRFLEGETSQDLCSADELKHILEKAERVSPDNEEHLRMTVTPEDIAGALRVAAAFWSFLLFFGDAAIQIVLCLVIFVGFFSLTSSRKRELRWGELVRIALYAGCPALFVAACFAAFDLTGILNFSTVYVIGTIGYFLVVVNQLEHSRRQSGQN